jgi:serine/threonine protein kinase/Tfp pilus assembly protein PilF
MQIGEMISHYRLLEKLGGGGMGVVYKAEDIRLKRFVALKFLPPELTRDPDAKKRFIHEAQAASALEDSNICTVFEIDETEDGHSFIVLSYCEGETVKKKIERGPLKLEEATKIALQVAKGLAVAHEAGVLHRDIKPANIMVTSKGESKIVDFGLAKLTGQTQITKVGSKIGTVAYMSPEQTRGEEIDERSDIWSLGVVLYEMITGKLPFKGEYDQAILYSILNEQPSAPSELRSEIPDKLEQIISKALAKNVNERYQHMNEFIEDLSPLFQEDYRVKITHMRPRTRKSLLIASSAIITAVILFILFYPGQTIPFAERDWVLITDFENLTKENVFNKSLYTAFTLSIDQSQYINVFSRRRMLATMERMKKFEQDYIDEETGREIAIREGINISIVPSISRIGNKYVLTAKIQDAATGDILKSEILYVQEENEILDQLDQLSKNIRKDLGESRYAIALKSRPLSKVTTSSLKALKQYSIGVEYHWKSNFEEAKRYYENALEIDTNFVSAKASLGILLFERFDRNLGKNLVAETIRGIDGLSDREKYGILAFHAASVENDLERAIEYTKMRLKLYPDDPATHNNLGWYYQQLERYDEAVQSYKNTLRINPYLMITHGGLIWCYLTYLGEADSALIWSRRMLSYDPENHWGNFYLGSAYVVKDSLTKAEQAFRKASDLNPHFIFNHYRLAHVYRLLNQYNRAISILKQILKINPSEESAHYNLGLNYQLLGNNKSSQQHYRRYLEETEKWLDEFTDEASTYTSHGIALTRVGKKELGWEVGLKGVEMDSSLHVRIAEFLIVQGKKQEALDQLEMALNSGYKDFTWLKLNPDFHHLYNDTRYKNLLSRFIN